MARWGVDAGTAVARMARLHADGGIQAAGEPSLGGIPAVVWAADGRTLIGGEAWDAAASRARELVRAVPASGPAPWSVDGDVVGPDERRAPAAALTAVLRGLAVSARLRHGEPVDEVVVAVPVQAVSETVDGPAGAPIGAAVDAEAEAAARCRAARYAGLTVVRTVLEPVAAAVHAGVVGGTGERVVLVVDVGASGSRVSLLRVRGLDVEIPHSMSAPVGGFDLDLVVADHILHRVAPMGPPDHTDERLLTEALAAAARLRRQLRGERQATTTLTGDAGSAGVGSVEVTLDRAAYTELVAPVRRRMVQVVREVHGLAFSAQLGQVESVVLVGGWAERDLVAALGTATDVRVIAAEPETAVAVGAAMSPDGLTVRRKLGEETAARVPAGVAPGRRTHQDLTHRDRPPSPRTAPTSPADAVSDAVSGAVSSAPSSPRTDHPVPGAPSHWPVGARPGRPAPGAVPPPARAPTEPSGTRAAPDRVRPVEDPVWIRMGPRLDVSWIWPDGVSEVHASWDPGYGGTAPRGEVVVSRRAYADGGGLRISGTDGSALVITLRAISSADRRHGKPVEIAVPAEPPAARYAVSSTGSRWRRPKLVVVTVTARQAGRTPPFDIVWETGPNRPLAADQGRHQMSVAPLDLEAGRPRSVEFAEPTRARPLWVVCFPTTGASDGPSADTSSADAAATGAMSMGIVPVDRPPAPVLLLRLVPESLLPLTK